MSQLEVEFGEEVKVSIKVGLVWATGISTASSSSSFSDALDAAVSVAREEGEEAWPAGLKRAVRSMLKHRKFRATGRNKPASEFLLQAAREGAFPRVSPLVDINNYVSLFYGLPASIFDLDLTGPSLRLDFARAEERYVFNASGHEIRLRDLLCVYHKASAGWVPCGNPVRDSMATKVKGDTQSCVAVIYGPKDKMDVLQTATKRYQMLLSEVLSASSCESVILPHSL